MPTTDIREPIAIIGIGCRFPGADDPRAFWDLLQSGRDAVREIPATRWDADAFYDPDPASPGKMPTREGGLLDSVDGFDWRAFRIPPREAKYMDPQHRLLLEVAWEALEDAGFPFEEVAGSRAGVFVAMMWNDYFRLQSRDTSQLNGYSATGNSFAFAPNRVSYTFDLKGPSVALDGACAGSLVSLHAACQSLWLGESSVALAGGVNLILSPDVNIMMAKAGVLSPGGRCRTLDAKADGFVRGEGAGIVVLKPYSEVTASDRVYALIRGSAVNHNGHNEWIMAASPSGQETVLADAYRTAGVDPATVDYIEMHGTGLPKGDPIEAKVLGAIIGTQPGRKYPCAIGSVKSNIGHLDSAAGIAGVIKVALSFHNGNIPPTLHLDEVNPAIQLDALGLTAQRRLGPWPNSGKPPLAGVTAISMSGANAHVVMQGVDLESPTHTDPRAEGNHLLALSAPSPESLALLVQALYAHIADDGQGPRASLHDICYTAGVRRSHHEHRLALLVGSTSALIEGLRSVVEGRPNDTVISRDRYGTDRELLPELAQAVDRCLLASESTGIVDPSLHETDPERLALLEAVGVLYVRGSNVSWQDLYSWGGRCVDFPPTQWKRERLWLDWLDASGQPTSNHQDTLSAGSTLLQGLEAAVPGDRRQLVHSHVHAIVAAVLGIDPPHQLRPDHRLFDVGMNSLSAVELVNVLQADFEQPLPATLAFEHPSAFALAEYLCEQAITVEIPPPTVTRALTQPAAADDIHRDTIASRVKELSEEEAEAQLLERLKGVRGD